MSTSLTAGLPLLPTSVLTGVGSHPHDRLLAMLFLLPWKKARAAKGAKEKSDTNPAYRE